MTSTSSPVDSIEKAMEGVTPGPWDNHRDVRLRGQHDVGLSICFVNCENGSRTDREARANAAYIATCSPDRMREVLVFVRALERENAELRKTVADCSDALSAFADSVFNDNGDMTVNLGLATGDDYVRAYFADRRARALLGGSDAGN